MRASRALRAGTAVAAAVAVVAAAGCSTKAQDSGGSGGEASGEVATDVGIEGTTITLGVLTDLTGVFAALGNDITNANQLFWQDNQVCDTYDVELDVQDTGYVPQTGVQLYSGMEPNILAMQQTIGSPINTALAQNYESDQIVNFPSAWARTLTEIPGTGVLGATYDVEISNGYDYLFKQGLLKEGDTVGHIYFEGEYGENGLAGTQAVAQERNLQVIPAQIKSSDQDMTAQITQFAAAGVDAIALTVAPTQTASAAAVAAAQGLNVPIIGSNPVFAPGLLQGPAAQALKDHLYVASPISAWDQHPDLLQQYQAAHPDVQPSLGAVFGYGMGETMKQVLDAACDNGDLTRAGVLQAFNDLQDIDTGGLIVPINGFEQGRSPSLESFILRPADVPGGATVVQDAFEGEFAEGLAG
ncbi:ABC transporter substrate-binding protein [Geodermatophilus sp. TF02-6]|uniref:ABC transporter substrate-binding protein n=1 Tax=Geodermatophilus sp. TF02-6 TaxID=2250575 RepID=UPI000DE97FB5|nr:ABC transporter substrate-binding protein [Geodermatophilus sp. TF02-6]RBY80572.1 ABC transporter substrate-binding protein [Geodermatophilus sp. TF02-6]